MRRLLFRHQCPKPTTATGCSDRTVADTRPIGSRATRWCGLQSDFVRAAISLTFINVRSNSDLRYCSCARSVGFRRNATFTKKRFNSEVIKRLSECFDRSAVSRRRISMRSSVSWSGCSLK
jgi:hypothetical protein